MLRASVVLNNIFNTAKTSISHGLLCFECGKPRNVQPTVPLQTTIPTKSTANTTASSGASVDQICAILRESGLANIDGQTQENIRNLHST